MIRRACAITDRVFERLIEVSFVGRTERDVSWDLTQLFHEEGADGQAFESIVGSGPTGSRPHARAGDRKIGAGELVVIDTGCTVDGYSSDYTRTFATGPLDGQAEEAYRGGLAAQQGGVGKGGRPGVPPAEQAGLAAIRGGLPAVEADGAARRVVEDSPFAGMF